jgi:hypothetical protein
MFGTDADKEPNENTFTRTLRSGASVGQKRLEAQALKFLVVGAQGLEPWTR